MAEQILAQYGPQLIQSFVSGKADEGSSASTIVKMLMSHYNMGHGESSTVVSHLLQQFTGQKPELAPEDEEALRRHRKQQQGDEEDRPSYGEDDRPKKPSGILGGIQSMVLGSNKKGNDYDEDMPKKHGSYVEEDRPSYGEEHRPKKHSGYGEEDRPSYGEEDRAKKHSSYGEEDRPSYGEGRPQREDRPCGDEDPRRRPEGGYGEGSHRPSGYGDDEPRSQHHAEGHRRPPPAGYNEDSATGYGEGAGGKPQWSGEKGPEALYGRQGADYGGQYSQSGRADEAGYGQTAGGFGRARVNVNEGYGGSSTTKPAGFGYPSHEEDSEAAYGGSGGGYGKQIEGGFGQSEEAGYAAPTHSGRAKHGGLGGLDSRYGRTEYQEGAKYGQGYNNYGGRGEYGQGGAGAF